jgi:hypothetical protein
MVSWSHVVPMATSICSSVVVGVEAPCCFQVSAASHQLLIERRRRRRRRSPTKGNCHSFHFQALRVVANCEAGEAAAGARGGGAAAAAAAAAGGPGGGDWGERKELGVVRNRPWVWRCVATTGAVLVVQAIAGDQDVANAIVTNYGIAAAQPMEFGVSLLRENEGFFSCLPASSAPQLLHSSAAGGVRRIGPGKLSHGKQQLTPVVVGTSRRVVSRKQVLFFWDGWGDLGLLLLLLLFLCLWH